MADVSHFVFLKNVDSLFDICIMLEQMQSSPKFVLFALIGGYDKGGSLIYLNKYVNYADLKNAQHIKFSIRHFLTPWVI